MLLIRESEEGRSGKGLDMLYSNSSFVGLLTEVDLDTNVCHRQRIWNPVRPFHDSNPISAHELPITDGLQFVEIRHAVQVEVVEGQTTLVMVHHGEGGRSDRDVCGDGESTGQAPGKAGLPCAQFADQRDDIPRLYRCSQPGSESLCRSSRAAFIRLSVQEIICSCSGEDHSTSGI